MYGGKTNGSGCSYLLRKTLGPAKAATVGIFVLVVVFVVVSFHLVYRLGCPPPTAHRPPPRPTHFGGSKIDPIQQCASFFVGFCGCWD